MGWSADELMSVPYWEFIHPARWTRWNTKTIPQQQLLYTIGMDISDARPDDERLRVGSWEWHLTTDEFRWSAELAEPSRAPTTSRDEPAASPPTSPNTPRRAQGGSGNRHGTRPTLVHPSSRASTCW